MALKRIVALIVLTFTVFYEKLQCGNAIPLDTYSIGNLMHRNLTFLEDKYVPTTGLYFLPYDVPYNGTLVEIEVCGFIGENFDPENNTLNTLSSIILIYRRVNNKYHRIGGRISIDITPSDVHASTFYGCNKVNVSQRTVNEGDRIAIFIPNPDCQPSGSDSDLVCFAHPNLVSPNFSLALYFPYSRSMLNDVMIEDAEAVQQFINMNITINASQNTSTNDSRPADCLLDPSPTTSTITQGELFNTSTTPLDETSTANTSTNLSWVAIFGAVVGSVLVILVSMTLVAMLCVLAKRKVAVATNQHSTVAERVSTDHEMQLKVPGTQYGFTNAVYSNNAEYEVIADSEDQLTEVASDSVTNTVNEFNDKKPPKMLNEARNRVHSIPNDYLEPYSASFAAVSDEHYEFDSGSNAFDERGMKQDEIEYDYDQMMNGQVEEVLEYEKEEEYFVPAKREDKLKEQLQQLKIFMILNTDLQLQQQIGSGQFGTVHRGMWRHLDSTNNDEDLEVAVKSIQSVANEEERVKFLQEATIMGQFNHPNVLSILGIVLDDPLRIVMDIMDKGDLHYHLKTLTPASGEPVSSTLSPTLLSYSRQIAFGLMYLDIKKFVHRDLAARNVLVTSSGVCKIADFGMSRDLQDENYYVAHGGMIPVKWTAPEALMYRKYSSASDVWSYGCLLYEIWSLGYKPFHDVTNAEAMKTVQNGYRLPPPPGCPRAIYHIMTKCWHPDAPSRPNPSNVVMGLSHPDFQILNWSVKDTHNNSEEARTLGASIESGHTLFPDLQKTYYADSD